MAAGLYLLLIYSNSGQMGVIRAAANIQTLRR